MLEKLKENKKIAIIAAIIVVVVVAAVLFLCCNKGGSAGSLKVKYSDGRTITYNKFSKKLKESRTITIENTSKEPVTYDLRWFKVENTLSKQDDLLYEISCKGDACQSITSSALPASDFPLFANIKLEGKKKHVYTISIRYKGKGNEKNTKFTGELRPLVVSYDDAM